MRRVLEIQERGHPNVEVMQDFRDRTLLEGSQDDLEQLFGILLGNAFDAVAAGGLIKVRIAERTNAKTGEPGDDIVVADSGKGMSAEVQSHLFQPFFSTKDWTGMGLGLWIASSIVDQHAGRMKIRSSQAKAHHGTVVSVFFPFHSAFSSYVTSAPPKAA